MSIFLSEDSRERCRSKLRTSWLGEKGRLRRLRSSSIITAYNRSWKGKTYEDAGYEVWFWWEQ